MARNHPLDHISENVQALTDHFVRRRRLYVPLFGALAVFVLLPALLFFMLPTILSWMAPPLDMSRDLYTVNRPIAFTFLDAEGNEVGHRGAIIGERLTLEEMPAYLPAAFIAMEDRRFYSHHGIDPRGLVARHVDELSRRPCRGGRLDHHPADRQDRLHQPGAHAVAQARPS